MDGTAFVFPGQGSQQVGMGLDLLGRYPDLVRPYYRAADERLGLGLSRLCWEGPADALRATSITQPAVFLTSLVALRVLTEHGVVPDVVAGHSLGEYCALVCSGVLDWTDALALVRLRGQLMESVNQRRPGRMSALLGLELPQVEVLCRETVARTGQVVEVANDNAPGQIVVSGTVEGVEALEEAAHRAGARRIVRLAVGAPFHCSLMADIEREFAGALADVPLRDPVVPVVSSVTGQEFGGAQDVRSVLCRQLTGRVRWTGTVARMTGAGAGRFVEVGPGRVLGALCRRAAPGAVTYATGNLEALDRALESLSPTAGHRA